LAPRAIARANKEAIQQRQAFSRGAETCIGRNYRETNQQSKLTAWTLIFPIFYLLHAAVPCVPSFLEGATRGRPKTITNFRLTVC
jgi:hypothetical protein